MKLNRKWVLVIALLLSVAAATAGTLAYLTDRDSEVNVFTMGNVDIDLKEDFEHGAELIPGVDIDKKPTITNVGKNDAWVWATIAIPSALDNDDASKNVVHFNYDKESVGAGLWNWKDADGNWNVEKNVGINGVSYNVYTVLYGTALKPGETTEYPVITKVYMDPHVDIDPEGNVYWVNNGEAADLEWNVNEYGEPIIYVSAYAMQTEGFKTVQEAYEAYNVQWGDNGAADTSSIPQGVSNLQELKDAAKNGGKYYLDADIHITDKSEFFYGSYVTAVYKDMTLDLNGHDIIVDVDMGSVSGAPILFYVYSEGAALTVVGDGDVIAKHNAFIFFPRSVSEGLYIYGGNYYNNDDTSGTTGDINAIVYSQTNDNIHVYGGTFTYKNVNGHCGGFNVYDNSGAEIVLHEGVLLSNSNYYKGSDADEIHLAEGCALQEVVIDGTTWYKVVKQ